MYETGVFAPGRKLDPAERNQVRHHGLLAHGRAVQAIGGCAGAVLARAIIADVYERAPLERGVQAPLDRHDERVEIDVQESADGEVIVVHDSDFMKLSGNPVKVWDVTANELAGIDVGRWFASEFAGEGVPTLRQVL